MLHPTKSRKKCTFLILISCKIPDKNIIKYKVPALLVHLYLTEPTHSKKLLPAWFVSQNIGTFPKKRCHLQKTMWVVVQKSLNETDMNWRWMKWHCIFPNTVWCSLHKFTKWCIKNIYILQSHRTRKNSSVEFLAEARNQKLLIISKSWKFCSSCLWHSEYPDLEIPFESVQ